MVDIFTKEQRSKVMASVKGSGNASTEMALIKIFRSCGIKGWRRGNVSLPGKPDFIFQRYKTAIFVDGCFWHGCKRCFVLPKSNRVFWKLKISNNIVRDRYQTKIIRKEGWKVLRIWEHQLKSDDRTRHLENIAYFLNKRDFKSRNNK